MYSSNNKSAVKHAELDESKNGKCGVFITKRQEGIPQISNKILAIKQQLIEVVE